MAMVIQFCPLLKGTIIFYIYYVFYSLLTCSEMSTTLNIYHNTADQKLTYTVLELQKRINEENVRLNYVSNRPSNNPTVSHPAVVFPCAVIHIPEYEGKIPEAVLSTPSVVMFVLRPSWLGQGSKVSYLELQYKPFPRQLGC